MREFLPRRGVGKQGFPRERLPQASVAHAVFAVRSAALCARFSAW